MFPSPNRPLPTKLVHSYSCQQGALRTVRFNANGNYCLTGSVDKTVRLWNPYKAALLHTYHGCGGEVRAVSSSADNSMILAGGTDKVASVFNVETGKLIKRFRGHSGWVNAVAFDDESSVAFSAGQEGNIIVWDLRDRREVIQTIDDASDAILCLKVKASTIISGSADHKLRIYDVRKGTLGEVDVDEAVMDAHLTDDGQCVLVAAMKRPLFVVDRLTGKQLAEYSGHKNDDDFRLECGILATKNEIVTGSGDGQVYVFDFVTKRLLAALDHRPATFVHSMSAHPKKCILLTVSRDRVFVWMDPEENPLGGVIA